MLKIKVTGNKHKRRKARRDREMSTGDQLEAMIDFARAIEKQIPDFKMPRSMKIILASDSSIRKSIKD